MNQRRHHRMALMMAGLKERRAARLVTERLVGGPPRAPAHDDRVDALNATLRHQLDSLPYAHFTASPDERGVAKIVSFA